MAGELILIVEDNDKNRKLVRDVLVTCWDVLAVDTHVRSPRAAAALPYLRQEGRSFRTILPQAK